jgi:2-isopropylmalate synthase
MKLMSYLSSSKVRIFDTTLRDGKQTPGASLTPEEKVLIARQLDRLGVDAIEAGTPITSKGELRSIKLIAAEALQAEVYGLARLRHADVDAVLQSDINHIHLFIATSDIHLKHKLHMTRDQVVETALDLIDYARDHGLIVEFSAEDATRTDLAYLKHFYHEVDQAGVTRINIPDTLGLMTPHTMRILVKELKSVITTPLSIHCHNDFGMAVANSLAGLEAGADQVHVAVNGLGERAGNASLEEIAIALNILYKTETNIVPNLIYQTSQLVSRLTGVPVQPNKAIVGENAFTHEAGIHQPPLNL